MKLCLLSTAYEKSYELKLQFNFILFQNLAVSFSTLQNLYEEMLRSVRVVYENFSKSSQPVTTAST